MSPTYAKEVLTPEGGEGLHTTLRKLTKKFYGIVNGIDDKVWNPATDPHLEHHFSKKDIKGKELLKNSLRQSLGMATEGSNAKRPLVSSSHHLHVILCNVAGSFVAKNLSLHVILYGCVHSLHQISQQMAPERLLFN